MHDMSPQISAFVITKDESAKIAGCLASLDWLDERVVVDDFSGDGTAKIASASGARVISNTFTGFRDQKRFAMDQTAHDWVLELDADERISPEMRVAIQGLSDEDFNGCDGFAFRRLTRFWGRWIRHGSLYPDYKVRLYHRRRGDWSDGIVHERFIPKGTVRRIPVDIVHEQDLDLRRYVARTARYAELSAADYAHAGKRWSWWDFLRPVHTFVYRFFIRRGFLDGMHGFLIAVIGAMGTFLKYAHLLELTRGEHLKEKR
jgi:glycosyltransferase involved in cell wall biosynthesis